MSVSLFSARRGTFRAALATLGLIASIAVAAPAQANTKPRISGTPPTTLAKGATYSFTPVTSDPDRGDVVRCYIVNNPYWLVINHDTCKTTGSVPANVAAGTKFPNIVILGSDGKTSALLPAFTLTVTSTPTAAAPTSPAPTGSLALSGAPATSITAGSPYAFTPTLSNTTGKTATYSVSNKPAWMTFSTATGALTGTPTASQAGTYANITVKVSNGTTQASLAPFTLTVKTAVTSTGTGSATVSWLPPTTNVTGGSLANLAGYRVHYGSSASALTQTLALANPGLTSAVVSGLASGAWYFAVSAYTTDGLESELSPVASKTVN